MAPYFAHRYRSSKLSREGSAQVPGEWTGCLRSLPLLSPTTRLAPLRSLYQIHSRHQKPAYADLLPPRGRELPLFTPFANLIAESEIQFPPNLRIFGAISFANPKSRRFDDCGRINVKRPAFGNPTRHFIEAPLATELMEGLEFFKRSSKKRLSVWNLLFSHGDRPSCDLTGFWHFRCHSSRTSKPTRRRNFPDHPKCIRAQCTF